MGLLDGAMSQQQPMQGGQFGGMPGGQQQAQASGGLQMAQQLAANPTPEMAQQIIRQMKQSGMEGADEIAQYLMQAGDNPEALKQIADAAIKALSGQ